MVSEPVKVWVAAEAIEAWSALCTALGTTPTPCTSKPLVWQTETAGARERAVAACSTCPLLGPCGTYAAAAGEAYGIWAGVDRTPRPATRNDDTEGES